MTIDEARERNITQLALPEWRLPEDHIDTYVTPDGSLGPWVKFYSPLNETAGNPNPVSIPIWECEKESGWVEWKEEAA